MDSPSDFRELLKRLQGDAEAARALLSEALRRPGDFTTPQLSAAQKVIHNALLAADRLDLYERIDAIEERLAKFKAQG